MLLQAWTSNNGKPKINNIIPSTRRKNERKFE